MDSYDALFKTCNSIKVQDIRTFARTFTKKQEEGANTCPQKSGKCNIAKTTW